MSLMFFLLAVKKSWTHGVSLAVVLIFYENFYSISFLILTIERGLVSRSSICFSLLSAKLLCACLLFSSTTCSTQCLAPYLLIYYQFLLPYFELCRSLVKRKNALLDLWESKYASLSFQTPVLWQFFWLPDQLKMDFTFWNFIAKNVINFGTREMFETFKQYSII